MYNCNDLNIFMMLEWWHRLAFVEAPKINRAVNYFVD